MTFEGPWRRCLIVKISTKQENQGSAELRVGEELRHALAQMLRPGEMRDPALHDANVTVTEVRMSPDLRNATAFVMPLGGANAADIVAALRRSAPYLKGRVARTVRAAPRPEPELRARQRLRQRRAHRDSAPQRRGRARFTGQG